jgi:two-component system NarL family sensor kinase
VLLCWLQRARVLQIANLIVDRGRLSTELAEVEVSARRDLAEELHDGALQYVLAAGLDLEDLRADEDPQALERIELALRESASLLRAKVSQLHPSVLETTGLVRALQDLADATAARGRLTVRLDCTDWSDIRRSPADEILYGAARELLANVVKHAAADAATIRLSDDDAELRLTVADDGRGFAEELLDRRLADGHIGLASQRIRTEAAGGSLAIHSTAEGTVAEIRLPAPPSPN